MRAFIVRPFGSQHGFDFDAVEAALIAPVLDALGLRGRTTLELAQQGDLREDVFHLLLTADLVVADVTIHNANVFYELGARHALRDRRTFLLRARGHDVPFDLRGERYLEYDALRPEASRPALERVLRATLDEERADSPLFRMLPGLVVQDPVRFLPVPAEFTEEVERAAATHDFGRLALLAEEARAFGWGRTGLALVADHQFRHDRRADAIRSYEALRGFDPNDLIANQRLGVLYQQAGKLLHSEQALRRALEHRNARGRERAEIEALHGSNAKRRWREDWQSATDPGSAALASPSLEKAFQIYRRAFLADPNHFYPGLNALALLTIQLDLADRLPDVWERRFSARAAAATARAEKEADRVRLAGAVAISLEAARERDAGEDPHDAWLEVSEADLVFLTSDHPGTIESRYAEARDALRPFEHASARAQLLLFDALALRTRQTAAALQSLGPATPAPAPGQVPRVLLFTGHRIDAPGRAAPRFPAWAEPLARRLIEDAVDAELALYPDASWRAVAGAAAGGDVLFHEVCAARGIARKALLAGPRDDYVRASVQDSGPDWVDRCDRVLETSEVHVLGPSLELPRWLRGRADDSVWQRSNLWMLYDATSGGAARVTLIALWDGAGGDGPGGTADMVRQAEGRGAKVVRLDARKLADA